jgi:restriction system protein
MIWRYDDRARHTPVVNTLDGCIFCGDRKYDFFIPSEQLTFDEARGRFWFPFKEQTKALKVEVLVCPTCGWWIVYRVEHSHLGCDIRIEEWAAAGALRNLSLTDISTPIDEIQQYLVARYNDRHIVHPRIYEEVVGSVFHSLGYDSCVTAYSGDGGIDVMVFNRSDDEQIGIQVKRRNGKIQAGQIRELAGALVLNDLTRGIFITTTDYTKGAESTARKYGERNLPIELWNADRFFDALKLCTRPNYRDLWDPDAPFAEIIKNLGTLPKTRDQAILGAP